MNTSLSLDQIKKSLSKFFKRYHLVIFVVVVIGGMIVVMFMLNNTIQSSSDTTLINDTPTNAGFDQETIDKLESLNMNSGNSQPLDFPSGRINPFVE